MDFPRKIWVNGKLADPRKPLVSAYDHGFLYGDGVYETVRVYGGKVFRFDGHYRRLVQSARGVGIPLAFSRETMRRAVESLIKVNRLEEASVRLTLSRGPGPMGFDPRPCKTPTLAVMPGPHPRHAPALYERGVTAALARTRRNPKASLDPIMKTTNNLNNILAKREAIAAGAYEAVMLNIDGYLAEGTISNIFFIEGGRLCTPSLDCGILEGVTRDAVIALAVKRGLTVMEGAFRPERLHGADEVFLTSTTFEVLPVTRLAEPGGRVRKLGGGRVGSWAPTLRSDYLDMVHRELSARRRS
jgi:branched-chain amino acid aminotransferase